MGMTENVGIAGRLSLQLRDRDGRVVEERHVQNLVTLKGRELLGRCFSGLATLGGRVEMAVGTGTTPPVLDNEALEIEVDRVPTGTPDLFMSGEGTARRSVVRVRATFPARAGDVQALTEAGVWLEQVGGPRVLFNRATFPVVNRTQHLELALAWEIFF